MAATVLRMADWRLVFVLPDPAGTVAFMATHTRGRGESRAHARTYAGRSEAVAYARDLASQYGCGLIGADAPNADSGDSANG